MAGTIKGIIVQIGGDTSSLQKALENVNSATSSLSKELKGVNSLLKLDPKNTELLAQKQEVLTESIEQTSKKLEALESVQDQVYKKWQKYKEVKPQIDKVAESITKTEKELEGLKEEQEKAQKAFEKGKITQQQFDEINNRVKECKTSLSELRKEQKELSEGTVSTENYRNYRREIILTENKLNDLTDELKQFNSENSNWTKVSKSLDEISEKVRTVGDSFVGIGEKMALGITLPVAGLTTAAVKVGNEFEAQMSRVQAIAGATEEELKQLTDQAMELGSQTSFSATEAAEGMENLASAGFTTQEIMEAMPGLLDLAASSGTDLATSSEIAASSIRGFGLDAEKAGHVADVFAEASARTNAQVEDMGYAMKYVAPVANTMGLKIEEVTAAIGIMSDAGIKGEQAGTTLRGALVRLTKPTDDMLEVMESLGVSFYDNEGKMKNLTEIVSALKDSTAGLTEEEQQYALTTLFGTESLSGMLALITRGPEELAEMTKSFESCDGSAQQMADTMLNNTSGAIEEMNGAIETLGIKIQQTLAPYIVLLVNKVQELINKFINLPESTQKVILIIAGLTAILGPVLIILGKLINSTSSIIGLAVKLIKGLTSVSGAIGGVSKALNFLTGPVGRVIAVIGTLIGIFVHLWNTNEDFRNNVIQIWNKIKEFFENYIQPIFKTVFENIGNIITTVKDTFINSFKAIEGVLEGIIKFISGVFSGDWKKAWEGVKQIFKNIVDGFVNVIKMPINLIIDLINGFIRGLNNIKVPDWVPRIWRYGFWYSNNS